MGQQSQRRDRISGIFLMHVLEQLVNRAEQHRQKKSSASDQKCISITRLFVTKGPIQSPSVQVVQVYCSSWCCTRCHEVSPMLTVKLGRHHDDTSHGCPGGSTARQQAVSLLLASNAVFLDGARAGAGGDWQQLSPLIPDQVLVRLCGLTWRLSLLRLLNASAIALLYSSATENIWWWFWESPFIMWAGERTSMGGGWPAALMFDTPDLVNSGQKQDSGVSIHSSVSHPQQFPSSP